jgi:hypothetical protein
MLQMRPIASGPSALVLADRTGALSSCCLDLRDGWGQTRTRAGFAGTALQLVPGACGVS